MSTPSRTWPVICPCPCKHYVYEPAKWISVLHALSPGGRGNERSKFGLTVTQIVQRLHVSHNKVVGMIFIAKKHHMVESLSWGVWAKTASGHHCLSRWKAAGWRVRDSMGSKLRLTK